MFIFYLPNGDIAVFVVVPVVACFRRLGFAVIVTGGLGKAGVTFINGNFFPLRLRTFIVYGGQRGQIKRIITNRRYAVGDGYAC